MAKKQQKTFTVYGKADILATIQVPADTIEQALEIAKSLKYEDFIFTSKFGGAIEDADFKITGVME